MTTVGNSCSRRHEIAQQRVCSYSIVTASGYLVLVIVLCQKEALRLVSVVVSSSLFSRFVEPISTLNSLYVSFLKQFLQISINSPSFERSTSLLTVVENNVWREVKLCFDQQTQHLSHSFLLTHTAIFIGFAVISAGFVGHTLFYDLWHCSTVFVTVRCQPLSACDGTSPNMRDSPGNNRLPKSSHRG
ncbi:hypothetical protein HAH_4206 [Haloarcula hispanica ATCC 33960]|uniref:Uncharacterized protein n=1 Tax=Haloarcula hispanica (strain ATCC 33960 / DSM 4426 / JCM 8911 / NBRC 102182 / NCIMB 2187 / VKM B-1755) TaxID=634497 RepID=G0HYI0_HALHT|nr:hypothetical protein HAH_4206 [Haloarcula hispanica ATCC 33960]